MSAFTEANTIQGMLAEAAGINGWTVANKDAVDFVNRDGLGLPLVVGWFKSALMMLNEEKGLTEAQARLDSDAKKDSFAETYGVLHRAWEILSPDLVLETYKDDYTWLSQVYESVRKLTISGGMIWKALGAKTIKLIHDNITSVDIGATLEELVNNSAVLDAVISEADA